MGRTTFGPLLAVVLSVIFMSGSVGLAQEMPVFELGFKALAAQIGEAAGRPLEDEHYGPDGDLLQQTTTGLMVWRKADGWTAFTDGATTWINGPLGLQSRLNSERFDWEINPRELSPGQKVRVTAKGFASSGQEVGYSFIVHNSNQSLLVRDSEYRVISYDATGTVIQTDTGRLSSLFQSSGTGIAGTMRLPTGQTAVRIDIDFLPGDLVSYSGTKTVFVGQSAEFVDGPQGPMVRAIIRNPSSDAISGLRISAVVYGTGGLIGGGSVYLDAIPGLGQATVEVPVVKSGTVTGVEVFGHPTP